MGAVDVIARADAIVANLQSGASKEKIQTKSSVTTNGVENNVGLGMSCEIKDLYQGPEDNRGRWVCTFYLLLLLFIFKSRPQKLT